jgi:hypothetical protein
MTTWRASRNASTGTRADTIGGAASEPVALALPPSNHSGPHRGPGRKEVYSIQRKSGAPPYSMAELPPAPAARTVAPRAKARPPGGAEPLADRFDACEGCPNAVT